MQNSDLKLGEALRKAASIDKARLDEEMKDAEEHVFSDEFNQKMEQVFRVAKRKSKLAYIKRYTAVAVLALVFIGGALWFTGPGTTGASKPVIDILEWTQNYFSFKTDGDTTDNEAITFDESQIGFLPEGFEKNSEEIYTNYVRYEYSNDSDAFITLHVDKKAATVHSNNKNISISNGVNHAGYAYTCIYNKDYQTFKLLWEDDKGYFYSLYGALEKDIMLQIMNSIKYER